MNLDWFLKNFKTVLNSVESMDAWKAQHEIEYEQLKKAVEDLENGTWTPAFISTLVSFLNNNLLDIIGELAKTVHFGLTNDGYFCAWIPDAYSFLTFDTISDYNDPLYGHLVLMYD